MVDVRALVRGDERAAASFLDIEMGGRQQARLGELHDVLGLRGFGAWDSNGLVGVATYEIDAVRAELAAIAVSSEHRLRGIGSALIDAVATAVASEGVKEVWLVTTNDNIDALRLYQRRGFRFTELHAGAISRARAVKP